MSLIKAELVTEVERIVGRTGLLEPAEQALALGLEDIAMKHDFREMLSLSAADVAITIADDNSYASLPDAYLRLKFVWLVRGTSVYPVDIKTHQWISREYPFVGTPRWVGYEQLGKFYFRPDPLTGDKARFQVSLAPALATAGSPIPGIDRALIAFAASWMFDSLEIPESADRWMDRYELAARRAIVSDRRSNLIQKPSLVGSTVPQADLEELLGDGPESLEA